MWPLKKSVPLDPFVRATAPGIATASGDGWIQIDDKRYEVRCPLVSLGAAVREGTVIGRTP